MKEHNEAGGRGSVVEESGDLCFEIFSEGVGVAEV